MKKGVCTEYLRKEVTKSLLAGPAALAGSSAFFWMEWKAGVLKDVRMLPLAVPVFLILFGSGVYLLAHGLAALVWAEKSDLCQFIRSELSPAERGLSGKAMLALVERDLDRASVFADGQILVGKEWLFVRNPSWKPVLRLEHLCGIKERRTRDGKVLLKFQDRNGGGPVTKAISPADAGAVRALLQRNVPGTP